MDFLLDPNTWIAFAMLTALEIVLGVDNIIFISILVGRLPPEQRDLGRRLGLSFAMVTRLLLLFSLSWIMGLTKDLFTVLGQAISGRDVTFVRGGQRRVLTLPRAALTTDTAQAAPPLGAAKAVPPPPAAPSILPASEPAQGAAPPPAAPKAPPKAVFGGSR